MGASTSCSALRAVPAVHCAKKEKRSVAAAAVPVKRRSIRRTGRETATGKSSHGGNTVESEDRKKCSAPRSLLSSSSKSQSRSQSRQEQQQQQQQHGFGKLFGSFFDGETIALCCEESSAGPTAASTGVAAPPTATTATRATTATATQTAEEGKVQKHLSSNSCPPLGQCLQDIFTLSVELTEKMNASATECRPASVDLNRDDFRPNSCSDATLRAGARVSLKEDFCTFPEFAHNLDAFPSGILLKASFSGTPTVPGRRGVSRNSSGSGNTQGTRSLGESAGLLSSSQMECSEEMDSGVTTLEEPEAVELQRIAALIRRMEMQRCALPAPAADAKQA